ncbi:hypothetical protein Taro_013291 [Colocasia esculenta]|uniref:Uncharacterized protein n=1 Tax=Colocasia esculenta TaxID=4460 RepID=A0A843UFH9_COLES|nr:hypothetical protein [Colocasia esculenta]
MACMAPGGGGAGLMHAVVDWPPPRALCVLVSHMIDAKPIGDDLWVDPRQVICQVDKDNEILKKGMQQLSSFLQEGCSNHDSSSGVSHHMNDSELACQLSLRWGLGLSSSTPHLWSRLIAPESQLRAVVRYYWKLLHQSQRHPPIEEPQLVVSMASAGATSLVHVVDLMLVDAMAIAIIFAKRRFGLQGPLPGAILLLPIPPSSAMASKVKRKDHLPPTSLPSFRGHPCTAPTTVVREPAMMPRLAPLLFILSVLFLSHWSTSGEADGVVPDGIRIPEPVDHEVNVPSQATRSKDMYKT